MTGQFRTDCSHTTPAEIQREVDRLIGVVGAGGGYIMAPSDHIQPDTPLENVLAVYRAIRW